MRTLPDLSLDTNVLIYAFDNTSPYHKKAFRILQNLTQGTHRFCLTWQVLLEFFAVVTNTSRQNRVTSEEAWEFLQSLLDSGYVDLVFPNPDTYKIFTQLVKKKKYSGSGVFDVFLAATLQSNNISKLITENVKDFSGIKGLQVFSVEQFFATLVS